MNKLMKKTPNLLFLLVFPLLGAIYSILNSRSHKAVDLSSIIDHATPFLPIFIIPYILWYAYIFGCLIYFCFKDTKVYFKTLIIIVIGELICFVIYYFFQTTVPRPTLVGDNFIMDLVQFIYSKDQPFNCFPSIHVLTTFAVILASVHIKKKHIATNLFIHIVGSLIIVSTLFVKQHVILDMISSMFLVTFLYGITFELLSFRLAEKSEAAYAKNK